MEIHLIQNNGSMPGNIHVLSELRNEKLANLFHTSSICVDLQWKPKSAVCFATLHRISIVIIAITHTAS